MDALYRDVEEQLYDMEILAMTFFRMARKCNTFNWGDAYGAHNRKETRSIYFYAENFNHNYFIIFDSEYHVVDSSTAPAVLYSYVSFAILTHEKHSY